MGRQENPGHTDMCRIRTLPGVRGILREVDDDLAGPPEEGETGRDLHSSPEADGRPWVVLLIAGKLRAILTTCQRMKALVLF